MTAGCESYCKPVLCYLPFKTIFFNVLLWQIKILIKLPPVKLFLQVSIHQSYCISTPISPLPEIQQLQELLSLKKWQQKFKISFSESLSVILCGLPPFKEKEGCTRLWSHSADTPVHTARHLSAFTLKVKVRFIRRYWKCRLEAQIYTFPMHCSPKLNSHGTLWWLYLLTFLRITHKAPFLHIRILSLFLHEHQSGRSLSNPLPQPTRFLLTLHRDLRA